MRARNESAAPWTLSRLLALPVLVGCCFYLSARWGFKPEIFLAYAGMSLLAFAAYAIDKSAAVRKRWRVKESTLLILGLACGWPVALLAQQLFRHKTSKASFVSAFWVTVVLNFAALFYLYADADLQHMWR